MSSWINCKVRIKQIKEKFYAIFASYCNTEKYHKKDEKKEDENGIENC